MSNNIILIGFMAVGKGRTARKLSEKTGFYTIDTDDLIETLVKKKIKKIFKKRGEAFFRELEQKTADWLEHHVDHTIVSTGGGFFQVRNLNRLGRVIHLHAPFDAILEKLYKSPHSSRKIKKRPLLQDLDRARQLYDERLPLYRRVADLEIQVGGRSRSEIATEIMGLLELEPMSDKE